MKQEEETEKGGSCSDPSPSPNPYPNLDPNPCPICLQPFSQESYLDRCFHRYCYRCILRWTQVVSSKLPSSHRPPSVVKCPLCKTENSSIIYGYDGLTYQQHFFNQKHDNSTFFSEAHKYRLQCYYIEPAVSKDTFKVDRYWKSRKYLQPNNWLQKWLTRELQALIQEEDVEIIMHHILGVIDSFSRSHLSKGLTPQKEQEDFKSSVADAIRPFLTARTGRFLHELELFLASGLTVEAYDAAYKRSLGWKKPEEGLADAEANAPECQPVTSYLYLFDDETEDSDWSGNVDT